jgi:hypothetical protein
MSHREAEHIQGNAPATGRTHELTRLYSAVRTGRGGDRGEAAFRTRERGAGRRQGKAGHAVAATNFEMWYQWAVKSLMESQ